MNTAAMHRDDLKPRGKDGIGSGLVLALLVHVMLVLALAFGVNWRASEPEGVEAELWAAVPQVAAQRAVEPEPPPKPAPKPEPKPEPAPPPKVQAPDPQIAIEKAKQEKLKKQQDDKREQEEKAEKAKAEKAKADKLEADKRKKEEARKDEQLAAQREANIKRILGEAGATGSTPGNATQSAGPSAAYAGRIKARIKPNILLMETIDGNPLAEVEVRAAPDGTIIARKLIKSSGVKEWDDAVLRAIDKTEILPRDADGSMPSPMVIAFRPRDF
jgi:colicin import membrane protein